MTASPPPTLRVRLAPRTQVLEHGRLLVGGVPRRLMRLHPAGADAAARWRGGDDIGVDPRIRALARRLLDTGLLTPDPAPATTTELAVVVPTHGRYAQLDRCLKAIRLSAPDAALVVVDDGSLDAESVERIALAHCATLVRHPTRRGPAAARNSGAAATDRAVIAFVDSDVVVEPGSLARLAGAFSDPATGAVAPRVHPLMSSCEAVASYEARYSRLDMGPQAGLVRIGGQISHVPLTTVAVRRAAFAGGFDERLEVGEDVDFIWRLDKAGWNVWYDTAAAVRHEHRATLREFVIRRFQYAASIGPLSQRHPEALPALWVDTAAGIVVLAVIGHGAVAATIAAAVTLRQASQLKERTDQPLLLSARLAARSYQSASRSLARGIRQAWWPLLAPRLCRGRRGRVVLAGAWTIGLIEAKPTRPSHAALAIADDLLATTGRWWSCMRTRTTVPLRPARFRAAVAIRRSRRSL